MLFDENQYEYVCTTIQPIYVSDFYSVKQGENFRYGTYNRKTSRCIYISELVGNKLREYNRATIKPIFVSDY